MKFGINRCIIWAVKRECGENFPSYIDGLFRVPYNGNQNTCSRIACDERRYLAMTEHEKELIHFIRNSSNPEKSLEIAIEVIIAYLQQLESSPKPSPDSLQESA